MPIELPEGVVPGTEEYDQFLAGLAQPKPSETPAEEPAPEAPKEEVPEKLLADKYRSVEDLEKAYLELQKAYSKKTESKPGTPPQIEDKPATEEVKSTPSEDFDFNKLAEEYLTQGKLSEESYKKLEEKGIPKQVVDGYAEGIRMKQEAYSQQIYQAAGGTEQFQQLAEWAAENLEQTEKDTLNGLLASGNLSQAKLAVEMLQTKYAKAAPAAPQMVTPKSTLPAETYDRYNSKAEFLLALRDPRYGTDEHYRNQVLAKLGRSQGVI